MPRLGVLGSLVWDTIHGPDGGSPVEDWGGIAYSLSAWDAVAPAGWTLLPLIKVGRDLRARANRFLADLGEGDVSLEHVRSVDEPTNRVSLFYHDRSRRCEKLTGGVPGWSAAEIEQAAHACDALYVNFISGWEIDLEGAAVIDGSFGGLAWCDVHSLILGVGEDGVREPRGLDDRESWLGAFDLVQVNEDELDVLTSGGSPRDRLAELLGDGPEAVFLTRGAGGAEWLASPGGPWRADPEGAEAGVRLPGREADPTGCGDVWGMSCFASLLEGLPIRDAVRLANRLAAAAAASHGTRGLADRLAGAARAAGIER